MTTTNINITSSAAILVALSFRVMAHPVNANAPVTCLKSIEINAPLEKVWSVLTGINEWTNWQTDIKSAHINGPLTKGETFEWLSGGAKIKSTLHTVEPLQAIGWTGKGMGIFAIHNWTIEEQNGMVIVRVNESMEGFMAKILKGYLNKNLEQGLGRWMAFLKKECEKK